MSELDKFPIPHIIAEFDKILSRAMMWKADRSGKILAEIIDLAITKDAGRQFGAAAAWLQFYYDMGEGIEITNYRLGDCIIILRDKVNSMRKQDPDNLTITLTRDDLRVLQDAARHLDHLQILEAGRKDNDRRNNKSKWTKKKEKK